jgi:hypothetical protein
VRRLSGLAIVEAMDAESALREFASRLDALGEVPTNEQAVVQLLAQSILESAAETRPVDVQFEYPTGIEFVDLVVRPDNLAIEVKFHRPIPSGKSRPLTAQFGEILNDVRKLASADATRRVLVLVTDDTGMTHLRNKDMLPVRSPESVSVGEADIRGLAITAQRHAIPQGTSWDQVAVRLIWSQRLSFGHGIAWEVVPAAT